MKCFDRETCAECEYKIRAKVIDEFRNELRNFLFDEGRYLIVTENDIDEVAEQLKEQKL